MKTHPPQPAVTSDVQCFGNSDRQQLLGLLACEVGTGSCQTSPLVTASLCCLNTHEFPRRRHQLHEAYRRTMSHLTSCEPNHMQAAPYNRMHYRLRSSSPCSIVSPMLDMITYDHRHYTDASSLTLQDPVHTSHSLRCRTSSHGVIAAAGQCQTSQSQVYTLGQRPCSANPNLPVL
jgi:hypothetical protein